MSKLKIHRIIEEQIIERLNGSNKIVIIYGPRQVGKTTLAEVILANLDLKTLSVNADQQKYIDVLSSRDFDRMNAFVSGYDILFIDEAQRIPEIGLNLKILKEGLPNLKIIVTGSSSFDLANKIREPLTGRTWSYTLYPIAFCELKNKLNNFELSNRLEERLVFGSYPEVVTTINREEREDLLEEITKSYLYKDVLDLANIKYPNKIKDLLKLLAFQIGSEVSISELSNALDINSETIANYINLL